jgi:hypothetical protein
VTESMLGDEFNDDQSPQEKEETQNIQELLDNFRPKRYSPYEKGWLESVIDAEVRNIRQRTDPREDPVRELARRRVFLAEAAATKRPLSFLKSLGKESDGQLTLGADADEDVWADAMREVLSAPMAFRHRGLKDGKLARTRIRVRLGAMTDADWQEWQETSSDETDARTDADHQVRKGARRLRDMMAVKHIRTTEGLLPPPSVPGSQDARQ